MINCVWHTNTIVKEELSKLPAESYSGRIVVIQSIPEAKKAVKCLRDSNVVGFDTETKPARRKGEVNNISLIQISSNEICFLFRTINPKILPFPLEILEDDGILKIGLSLKDDFGRLRAMTDFTPRNFIELQTYVKDYGIIDNGLSRIYADVFGRRISKRQRLSNWEADFLTNEQKKYAALDAWATLRIYNELENFKKTNCNKDN